MPLQLILRKTLANGKVVFKRGNRRVSESAYRSQQWRIKGGKAGTALRRDFEKGFGDWMRVTYGPPGGSMTWKQIATKYPEKLEDYIDEYRETFR